MGRVPTILVTAVLSAAFGFAGAVSAMVAFQDEFRGVQGAVGLQGAPGAAGIDGADGTVGETGKRGKPGKAAKAAKLPSYDLGTDECAGASVDVVTDAKMAGKRVNLTKDPLCITGGPGE